MLLKRKKKKKVWLWRLGKCYLNNVVSVCNGGKGNFMDWRYEMYICNLFMRVFFDIYILLGLLLLFSVISLILVFCFLGLCYICLVGKVFDLLFSRFCWVVGFLWEDFFWFFMVVI